MIEKEITVEYEYDVIIERLAYHRKRLNISKEEIKDYIFNTYKTTFHGLTDKQIIELGYTLNKTKHKNELIKNYATKNT